MQGCRWVAEEGGFQQLMQGHQWTAVGDANRTLGAVSRTKVAVAVSHGIDACNSSSSWRHQALAAETYLLCTGCLQEAWATHLGLKVNSRVGELIGQPNLARWGRTDGGSS